MEKHTVEMALLLDFYGELLTKKQREYLELYYSEDFSLTEIAALHNITPQGARDVIQRGERILKDTETKTSLLARFGQVSNAARRMRERLKALETQLNDENLSPLFQKLYSDLETLR